MKTIQGMLHVCPLLVMLLQLLCLFTAASAAAAASAGIGGLQSPDFYERKSVNIGNVVAKPMDNNEDKSWPPANAHEFAKIDITVMGKRVDGATLHNLVPDMSKMKPRKLRKILDTDFDTKWMAISKPQTLTARQPVTNPFAVDSKLSSEVNKLNFTFQDTVGAPFRPDPRIIYMFKSWLLRQAACPLEYLWEDLGVLFWPRWIKRGVCSTAHSCSWPPGMRCRPSGSRNIKVLRWVCTDAERSDYRQRKRDASGGRSGSRRRKKNRRRNSGRRKRRKKSDMRSMSSREGWEKRARRRRQRKRRRLMRKLSVNIGGYYCQWMIAEYPVIDHCACMCT